MGRRGRGREKVGGGVAEESRENRDEAGEDERIGVRIKATACLALQKHVCIEGTRVLQRPVV